MVETPAAVMIADELAREVDFFSLGTNDLAQYTLAIDRQNPRLDPFYDPHHPAVLRMVRMAVEAGHRHGCWVGICGELGADLALTELFLRMGVDELSVSPPPSCPCAGASGGWTCGCRPIHRAARSAVEDFARFGYTGQKSDCTGERGECTVSDAAEENTGPPPC